MARPLPKALLSQDFDSRFIYGLPDAKKSVPLAPSHPTQTNAWIDKLLELNKADVDHKGDKIPTTAGLVDTMKRYDAIFGEIINQTGKYSEKLASLQIKAWGGVMQLLECMVKGSHRYAKQTAHLQEEAKAILSERKTREFSDKRNEEEFNYEKASIRAQLRNAESQAEALVIENRILKREKDALREVIRVYIQSGMEITAEGKAKTPEELSKPQSMPKRSSSKESAVTLQEKHFQTIMALDVDMNTALDEVYHESNNFQGLLSKLSKVLVSSQQPQQNNNKDTISSGKTLSERGLVVSHTAKQLDYQKAALFRNTATQVDEKDVMGALDLSPNAGLVRIHIREALPLIPWEEVAKIPSVPSQLEAFMVYKYSIKRIPSLQWLHQLIYAIYRDRIQYNQLLSLQANEKRDVVYIRPSLSTYVYTIFFQNRFQVSSSIDVQCATLLQAISFHCERSPRVRLFAAMIGLQRAGAYTMDNCDSDFIISIFDAIFNCSQFCIDPRTHIEMIPLAFSYELVETLIGSSSTECASECSKGIRALDTSGPSDSFVSVDEVITVLTDNWYGVRHVWEEHISFLGRRNCSVFKVTAELTYGKDPEDFELESAGFAKDVAISKVFDKASVQSAPRRPLRIFDAFQLRSISGREVSEVLSKKEFFYACSAILPSISEYEVDEMFNEACELIRKRSLRACVEEGGWREVLLENGRKVHVNINMKRAQWRAPYTEHSYFDSSGVDIETFVAVVLQQNLLMRGPYASFINAMRPEDFWPHAATHLKQKLEAESAE